MDRRRFVLTLAGGVMAGSLDVYAQRADRVIRIGFLRVGTFPLAPAFRDAMRRLGWIERENFMIEPRYAASEDRLPELATELVNFRADAIVTSGTPAAFAAKKATATIPIVFIVGGDPVERGLVVSLARPGGNLTGFAYGIYDEKLLEALKTMLPKVVRVAVPYPAAWKNANVLEPAAFSAAKALGLQLHPMPMQGPDDFSRVYAIAQKAHADAVLFFDIAWPFAIDFEQIAIDSIKSRMPAIFHERKFVEAGGLLSHGPVKEQHWPRVASQIDRILRGTKPADLPVEQPTKFERVINLKTAKALGIEISPSALQHADDVIR
jgi:putative ABC transport system substrate-binding protein